MPARRRLRRIRRLAYLGAFTGTVIVVRRSRSRRSTAPTLGPPATWPPLEVGEPPVAAVGNLASDEPWVAAVDGACPATHPVRVSGGSGIYHLPGGRFYDRTRPERCYLDAAAAEADGYRAAKGS